MQNPKVLLVSADRTALRQLSRFLELFGYPVVQASDAELAVAATIAARPDLMIVDDDLAAEDSMELVRSVRQHDRPDHFLFALMLTGEPEAGRFVQALEAGVDDFLAKPVVYGELLARLRAATSVVEAERRVRASAHIDPLTALASRGAVVHELEQRLQGDGPSQPTLSLIVADIDCLEHVNHEYGYAVGDELLKSVALELEKHRGDEELLARLQRDRFAVVLPNTSDVRAAAWAERVRRAIAHLEFTCGEDSVRVTASFGVAASGKSAATGDELFERAGEALKVAKRSGRNCVVRHGEFAAEDAHWQELAAPGRLFEGTVARDVMAACALIVHHDDDAQDAAERLDRGRLDWAPVVDADGNLVGLLHLDDVKSKSRRSKPRVADLLQSDPPTFRENESFKALFDFFVEDSRSHAVIVRDRAPVGVISRNSLADLIEVPSSRNDTDEARAEELLDTCLAK